MVSFDHLAVPQEPVRHALTEAVFEEINRQLDASGLILRQGAPIDATLVRAAVRPPAPGPDPGGAEGTVALRDPQVDWTTKHGKSHFGDKAHIATDPAGHPHGHPRPTGCSAADPVPVPSSLVRRAQT